MKFITENRASITCELLKFDTQINGDHMELLVTIVHKDKAYAVGRASTRKLNELIQWQMFTVPIQACIGAKVIASEFLSAAWRQSQSTSAQGFGSQYSW